jgi:hypothetical protein
MDEVRKKVENNLRFILTISVFFLAVLPEIRWEGSILISTYLLSYVLFELGEKKYDSRNLWWINISLLITMCVYAGVFFIFALSTQNIPLSTWKLTVWEILISSATFSILFFPLITLGFCIFFILTKK